MVSVETASDNTKSGHQSASAKWAALVNDGLAPMPRRRLRARDILHQSGADASLTLVRDYNGPNDVGFDPETTVDLADGNVFRTAARCERLGTPSCDAPPKLAFVVDDRWEVTVRPQQTGATLRGLLNVPEGVELFRDFESPLDEPISDDERIEFSDGPVFVTRGASAKEITIIVNGRPRTVTKRRLTFGEIVALAFNPVHTEPNFIYTVQFSHGPHANPEGELTAGQSVKIQNRMVFLVTETDRS